ncbi:MAG: hypothetical protein IPH08_06265 [Rhodocyclaceae bacterium]|nr:hypothetical protein [Rhodocyclaceae bacterium]
MNPIARFFLRLLPIALSCVALQVHASDLLIIVNSANLTTLSEAQIADLYAGKEARFPDGRRAVVVDQNDRQEIKRGFYQRLLDMSIAQARAEQAKLLFSNRAAPPREAFSSKEVAALVGSNPNAIGYIDAPFLLNTHRVLARWPQ